MKTMIYLLLSMFIYTTANAKSFDITPIPDIRFAFSDSPHLKREPTLDHASYTALSQAVELISENKISQAVTELTLAIEKKPNAILWYSLAQLEHQQDKTKQAITSLRQAIHYSPQFSRAHQLLGALLTRQGNYTQARSHLQLASTDSHQAGIFGLLGYGYLQQKLYLAAKLAYQEAIIREGDNLQWHRGLLQSAMALEDYSLAQTVLTPLLEAQPDDAQLWQLRANIALGQEQEDTAIAALEVAQALQSNRDIQHSLAQLYLKHDLYRLAVPYLNQLLNDIDAADPDKLVNAIEYLLTKQQYKSVEQLISRFLKRQPKSSTLNSRLYYMAAKAAIAQQHRKQAIQHLKHSLRYDSRHGRAMLLLAGLYQTSKPTQAEALLTQAATVESVAIQALEQHAQMLIKQKAYQRAKALLLNAEKREPHNRRHQQNIAIVERLIQNS